ncbi:YpjP family protein [Sporosarcina ureae]|uniref:YpjP family protein n=1 Tax=Sporosarcina ureae TaxID=1571 RepID=UPI0026F21815|nr:YpjP family protein [Sporosarcina ureae]
MKQWLQRLMIASVAVLTLGVITPNHEIWTNFTDKNEPNESGTHAEGMEYSLELQDNRNDLLTLDSYTREQQLVAHARLLTYEKFGQRIGPVIQNEFDQEIFPRIEAVIQTTVHNAADRRLAITEQPSGDYAEKIFHVYDKTANQDLIKFHVRTEKRPSDGYFYNFHYHTADDGFVAHHSVGDIYWSKNTPPKWLS